MLAYLMAKNRTVPVLPFKRIGRKLMKTTQVVEETYLLSLKLSCVFRCAVALIHVSAELWSSVWPKALCNFIWIICWRLSLILDIRGPFAKFVDSYYYSESELCGGAVTISLSKHLPWQAMHFLQRSTHFSQTCCRPLITSKFLASELPFHGWKSPEISWLEI
jgi:hypothetical protein